MANITYNHLYKIYVFRDNNLKLYLSQGEGLCGNSLQQSSYKQVRLQLFDDRGVIPISNNEAIELRVTKNNGSKHSYNCFIEDGSNGIIYFPITTDMTDIVGFMSGDIYIANSNNELAFEGVNFIVNKSVDVDIIEELSQGGE